MCVWVSTQKVGDVGWYTRVVCVGDSTAELDLIQNKAILRTEKDKRLSGSDSKTTRWTLDFMFKMLVAPDSVWGGGKNTSLFGTGRVPIDQISCTPVTRDEGEAMPGQ